MSDYQIISWRDIPVQVRAREGAERRSLRLPSRFQEAATRAAYRGRAITGEDHMIGWNGSAWLQHDGTIDETLQAVAADIEVRYPPERLLELIHNKGYDKERIDGS